MTDLADYAWLTGDDGARWLADLSAEPNLIHRQLQRLRKVLCPPRARLVVEQIELRRRAETKFGPLAARMFFTEVALEQATDLWIARYKAARFALGERVHDYCCGIGGDLLALAGRGPVVGWDRAPEIAWLAGANLGAAGHAEGSVVRASQVEGRLPHRSDLWHLDPDRRIQGRRSTRVQAHSPGPEVIARMLQASQRGALKLAPAAEVPTAWQREGELEWISWNRQCRQLVVWFNELAREVGQRRATRVARTEPRLAAPEAVSFQGDATCRAELTDKCGRLLYDVDPAVRAAGLTGALAEDQHLAALGAEAGYLTGARETVHPLLIPFRVVDELPLRVGPLGKHLRARGIGHLEIKQRGVQADPQQLRGQLKLRGKQSRVLLLTRVGRRELAFLADRCRHGLTKSIRTD